MKIFFPNFLIISKTLIYVFSAILELAVAVDFAQNIKPICMPFLASRHYRSGAKGLVAGWGWDGQSWASNLKKVDVNIFELEDCQKRMDNWWEDHKWHTIKE